MRFKFEGLAVLADNALGLLRHAVGHIRIDFNRDPHLGLWQDRQVLEDLLGDPARVPAGAVRVQINGGEEAFGTAPLVLPGRSDDTSDEDSPPCSVNRG